MSNSYFKFKQFVVEQGRCAMKVGTDGVLLGAWVKLPDDGEIMDLGTGTGLIALMMAQRTKAHILCVDISEKACEQAMENISLSPWPDRMTVLNQDVKSLGEAYRETFDCIVSNPPYFQENVKCPGKLRNTARHTDELNFNELTSTSAFLLKDEGTLSVVLPADVASEFIAEASSCRLFLSRQTWIHTKPGAQPKRVLMTFIKKQVTSSEVTHMTIHEVDHSFSEDYKNLTKDYYLDL